MRALRLAAALLAAGCSPLKTFDALMPKDGGSARAAEGVAYGAGPRRLLDVYAPIAESEQFSDNRRPFVPSAVEAQLPSARALRLRSGRTDEDLSRSNAAPADAHPVVVFFYGGSWSSGTRSGYAFVGRALAAKGFVTVVPDYRLVPEVRYPAFLEDGAAAVRWAEAHAAAYGGDPRRIVLMGHSAGAYIAAMLALDERWLGADRGAVKGFVGLAGPYDFAPFDVAASRDAFGAWPKPAETQPISWAGAGDPPSLLLVGDADRTVRPRNSLALAAKLAAAGVPVRVVHYPRLGHIGLVTAIALPLRGRAPVLADVSAFVDRVTR